MGSNPCHLDNSAQGALTPGLNQPIRGFQKDRRVTGHQLRMRVHQAFQPVELGSNLLAVVQHTAEVAMQCVWSLTCQQRHAQYDGHTALHVYRTQTPHPPVGHSMRQIPRWGDGIQVTSEQHALGMAEVGCRDHHIADTMCAKSGQGTKCLLNQIGNLPLLMRLAGYVDERTS